MVLRVEEADLLDGVLGLGFDVLVVPCPASGAFAGPLADRLLQRWPYLLRDWADLQALGMLQPGRPHLVHTLIGPMQYLALFPIRDSAAGLPRPDLIESCFSTLHSLYAERGVYLRWCLPSWAGKHPRISACTRETQTSRRPITRG
jgi:hypothetical protein